MDMTYIKKALGVSGLLFAFQTSAQGDALTLQQQIAESLKNSIKLNHHSDKCDMERRFNQKYFYIYEPIGESYTWTLKPEKGGGMIQFTFFWGGSKDNQRPYDKRRACRSSIEHGGLVGAFIPR